MKMDKNILRKKKLWNSVWCAALYTFTGKKHWCQISWTKKIFVLANCMGLATIYMFILFLCSKWNAFFCFHANPFVELMNILWAAVFNTSDPTSLQRTVFFYLGKAVCLQKGQEQHDLKPSQLSRHRNPGRFVYVEHGSKNWSGRLDLQLEDWHTQGILYSLHGSIRRWAFENEVFYCKSLDKCPANPSAPWYCRQACGNHELGTMIRIYANLQVYIPECTNHVLQSTGTTSLYRKICTWKDDIECYWSPIVRMTSRKSPGQRN